MLEIPGGPVEVSRITFNGNLEINDNSWRLQANPGRLVTLLYSWKAGEDRSAGEAGLLDAWLLIRVRPGFNMIPSMFF